MCTYNGACHLTEQLESIATQTQQPGELIICDDGSTDETVLQIKKFSRKVSFPVRLYCNANKLGPAKNFEKAIGLCEGEIIILCDQDDVWQPEKVEKICRVLNSHPGACYAFSDAQIIGSQDRLSGQTLWEAVRFRSSRFVGTGQMEILLKGNVVTGAGLAFRSSFCETVLPIPSCWMHDYWIGLLGSAVSNGIAIPEKLYKYRRHEAQVCGWRKKSFFECFKISLVSDGEDLRDKLCKFQELIKRLQSPEITKRPVPERIDLLKQKELHLSHRAMVRSSNGIFRIRKVFTEALRGRYSRFSSSCFNMVCSIARDLTPV